MTFDGGTDNNIGAKTQKKPHKPNILSRIFIWWMCPVLIRGNQRDIVEDDLIIPKKTFNSENQGEYLERYWIEEYEASLREQREPSLWKALRRAYWLSYMPGAIYLIIMASLRIVQPLVFAQLLSYWSVEANMTRLEASYYALALLGINFVNMMCQHHNSLFVARFGIKIRVACSSLIFRKLLRMDQVSLGDVSGGKLINLLSNDVARFDFAFMFLHYLWMVPVQAAVVLYFLYISAGYAPFVGFFGVVILILPIQAGLTKLTSVIRRETAQRTDRRIKLMTEIIGGIQVIKMYAWEKPFQTVVKLARSYEMVALRKSIFVRSVFLGFMLFTERSMIFFTSLTLLLTGNLVTATLIYPIQQYISIIQINLTMILPLAIASLSEMLVSLERIQNFLVKDEREDISLTPKVYGNDNKLMFNKKASLITQDVIPKKYSTAENLGASLDNEQMQQRDSVVSDYPIELSRVDASWLPAEDISDLTLRSISLRIGRGKLCAIIGPVGSGKSSILQVLLKELAICSGSLRINGKISYACQESWLFSATVRENILFGLPYDPHKYQEVCKVCSLLPDFQQFPYGDLSLVGERGLSLSGGQRARINLARAVYREADIYLLDDPLSAVDANVGRQLFEGCIKGYLRGRTCVLVTHQIHYLKAADIIVIMNEGTIENVGTYDDLVNTGTEFSKLLTNQESNDDEKEKEKRPSFSRTTSKMSTKSVEETKHGRLQVQEEEKRATGNLKFAVLYKYLASVQSWFLLFLTIFTMVLTQGCATFIDYWLSFWTNQVDLYEQSLGEDEEPSTSLDTQAGMYTLGVYLWTYGGVILILIVISHLRILSFVITTMRASATLHNTVYKNLIITVMRFFDMNPSGRVLNRFSKDMGAIDEFLPRSMFETVQMYLTMTSILVLNAIALPWTLIPTAVLLFIFIFLLKWYLNAAQAVKRLEGTTKSPVLGMITSTLAGLSTIRSSNSQGQLLDMFDSAQNLHTSAFYTFVGGSTAFGLYLDALCLVYLGVVLATFLVVDFTTLIPVGSVGLAVSQSMVLTMMLQMAARFTADFLGQMTAVERVLEYTELPMEENMYKGSQPPEVWPSQGRIEFQNVCLNYSEDDPPVLNNLNFVVENGWKVGVVGRTGAGKSSMISALFRLYKLQGQIIIDGIDTNTIAKTDLRSKISIIPQEPVLFSASVRYNLDPFETYSDDEIWRALEQVELKEVIPALDYKVSEGGSNFSTGQRQLVCLARAILRSNKVLVMDEATANVDPQTDALIQKTIRREFASCTVITIAHRLNTIMDSDRVLVMDRGIVSEYDTPYNLLSNPNSKFSSMVRETGDAMSKVLFQVAKDTHLARNAEK